MSYQFAESIIFRYIDILFLLRQVPRQRIYLYWATHTNSRKALYRTDVYAIMHAYPSNINIFTDIHTIHTYLYWAKYTYTRHTQVHLLSPTCIFTPYTYAFTELDIHIHAIHKYIYWVWHTYPRHTYALVYWPRHTRYAHIPLLSQTYISMLYTHTFTEPDIHIHAYLYWARYTYTRYTHTFTEPDIHIHAIHTYLYWAIYTYPRYTHIPLLSQTYISTLYTHTFTEPDIHIHAKHIPSLNQTYISTLNTYLHWTGHTYPR